MSTSTNTSTTSLIITITATAVCYYIDYQSLTPNNSSPQADQWIQIVDWYRKWSMDCLDSFSWDIPRRSCMSLWINIPFNVTYQHTLQHRTTQDCLAIKVPCSVCNWRQTMYGMCTQLPCSYTNVSHITTCCVDLMTFLMTLFLWTWS